MYSLFGELPPPLLWVVRIRKYHHNLIKDLLKANWQIC